MEKFKNLQVDLLKLVYSVNLYAKLDGLEDPNTGSIISADNGVYVEGAKLLRKYSNDLDSARDRIISVLEGKPIPSIESAKKSSYIGEWSSSSKIEGLSIIFGRFLTYTSKNLQILNEIDFESTTKAKALIRGLSSFDSSGSNDFNQIVLVPNCSRARKPKAWYESALKGISLIGSDEEVEESRNDLTISLSRLNEIESVAKDIKSLDRRILVEGQLPELVSERAQLEKELFKKADASGERGAALSLARDVLFKNDSFLSETGKTIGQITEEQERAMICEGANLISAGAGSGKTKVLAGKVVYHIKEQGVPMDKVIAVAFNKKASLELGRRIIEYGGESLNPILSKPQFKTTHSFAKSLIHSPKYPQFRNTKLVADDADVEELLNAAIFQVSLGNSKQILADKIAENQDVGLVPEGYFDFSKANQATLEDQVSAFVESGVKKMIFMYQKAQRLRDKEPDQANRLERYARADYNIFQNIAMWDWNSVNAPVRVKPFAQWTPADKDSVNKYTTGFSKNRASRALEDAGLPTSQRFADDMNLDPEGEGSEKLYTNRMVPSVNIPLGSWFNFGHTPFRVGKASELDEETYGDIASMIGHWQAGCVAPDTVFVSLFDKINVAIEKAVNAELEEEESTLTRQELAAELLTDNGIFRILGDKTAQEFFACLVYGAFQRIKGEQSMVTFDDSLVFASKLLIENPVILESVQQKYSHILVDEAQDLNIAQHTLFGLIAGTIDPKTGRPFEDDREMKANTFCFIGDDKQAIYGFRGAKPDQFTGKSDLKGGKFKTQILSTNFRSGRQIVEAANNLIKYNEDQIPMVCNANPSRDEGVIEYVNGYMGEPGTSLDGDEFSLQESAINEIKSILDSEGFNKDSYKIGIITRTNKEGAKFALNLIAKGIPYYSRTNLIRINVFNALAESASIAGNNVVNSTEALVGLTKTLKTKAKVDFKLDDTFRKRLRVLLKQHTPASPVDWFIQKGWSMIYTGKSTYRNEKDCKSYADLLFSIRSFQGSPLELIQFLVETIQWNIEDDSDDDNSKDGFQEIVGVMQSIFERFESVDEASDYCSEITKISEQSTKKSQAERMDVVFIGTAHSWKGLEADHVWIAMPEKGFPNQRALEEEGGLLEERRLGYVALTRGRDSVNVLAGRTGSSFIQEACIKPRPGTVESLEVPAEMEDLFTDEGMKMARQMVINSFPKQILRAMKGDW
jgi:superfamily I DNA/RNA helicase